MHWLARVFASAIARRIAYVVVGALLLWAGTGKAQAANCEVDADQCTQPAAYNVCMARTAQDASRWPQMRNVKCEVFSPKVYRGEFEYSINQGRSWMVGYSVFARWVKGCSDEKDYTGTGPWSSFGGAARSGSTGCRNGCDGMWLKNADASFTWTALGNVCPEDPKKDCQKMGPEYYWNPVLNVCEPPSGECPEGGKPNSLGQCAPEPCPDGMAQQADGTCKKKENECPAGQVRSPDGKCLPGDGQCAKGEVRGQDGTCKKDADNDGKPDPVTDESFSGGDDCNAPPSCSGSPIMCGQARIQWRIDCNTRKSRNISGGLCSAMPVCTGEKCDAMEYSALLMQWRSACALEKMAQGNGNGGGENADVKAIRDALTGTGGTVTLPPDRPASDAWAPGGGTATTPDTSGYGWGGTCPQPPSIEVFGNAIQINTAPLCNWLFLGGYFVMGLAALASLRIVASKDA